MVCLQAQHGQDPGPTEWRAATELPLPLTGNLPLHDEKTPNAGLDAYTSGLATVAQLGEHVSDVPASVAYVGSSVSPQQHMQPLHSARDGPSSFQQLPEVLQEQLRTMGFGRP